jgi:hypothetical protein
MKKPLILILAVIVLVNACKKDSKTTPVVTTTTTTTTNPYYFNFTLGSTTYHQHSTLAQYMTFYPNEIGGYEIDSAGLYPSIGLRLSWPSGDTVKESDVTGLVGKTLYYTDTLIHPSLEFNQNPASDIWYSNDTSNTSYNVKITGVVFLKKDTTLGTPLRTYVITGTCSGVMSQGGAPSLLTGGTFNFIISRQDH